MYSNLLKETLEYLEQVGVQEKDILYVAERDYQKNCKFMSWEDFMKKAHDKNYDNGYGGAEVNTDLLIYTKDYILYRHEYDGAEWWQSVLTVEGMNKALEEKEPEDFYI